MEQPHGPPNHTSSTELINKSLKALALMSLLYIHAEYTEQERLSLKVHFKIKFEFLKVRLHLVKSQRLGNDLS